jgi:glycerol kinase
MTVSQILDSVQFVVDRAGKPTAAMLDINVWSDLRAILEELEDKKLIQDRLNNWRTKEGWTRWEDFEAELETDAVSTVG